MFSHHFILLFCFIGVCVFEDDCPLLTWQLPPSWYAGSRRYLSYQTVGCTELVEYQIFYSCDPISPFTTCDSTSSDPRGTLKNHFSLDLICGILFSFLIFLKKVVAQKEVFVMINPLLKYVLCAHNLQTNRTMK
jgi:hypothetical protein